MKHYSFWFLYLLSIFFFSCDEDKNGLPTGVLYLGVEEDNTLLTKAQNEVTYESLQVAILKGEEDTLKVYNDYLTEVKGQRLVLPVGSYTIAVSSNHSGEAGWEMPFYQGQETVEVKQGEITNTKVTCTIANTKVSIKYGDSVKEHFTDYQTTVSNTSGSLLFTRDEYRSGYFTPEKLTVQLKLVNNDGNEFILKKVYPDIQPQYHYTFKFTLSDNGEDDEAGADMDVTVDKEHKEVTYDIFIKEEDELFGKGEPKLCLDGEFKKSVLTFKKKDDATIPAASLKLSVPNKIQSVLLKTSSWQLGESQFDQTNWPTSFPAIDFNVIDQTIDFSSLIEFLQPEGTTTALHKFTLTVLDKLNQEEEISFGFEIKANVPVLLGTPVVWANFAVLAGESENLDDVYFRFRKKNELEYQTIEGEEIVKNPVSGVFTALVKDLKPETIYEYQAVADGEETEWLEINTESAFTGVNMGFEDWCTVDNLPRPWKSGETKPFWGCGNSVVIGVKAIMTESSEDNYKGEGGDQGSLAAYMYSKEMAGKFAAGNIFTGDFELYGTPIPTNGRLTLGRSFSGRPSQLVGYYKYSSAEVSHPVDHLQSKASDLCSIYIALTTEKIVIDTGKRQYFDTSNNAIIAYGELPASQCGQVDDYTKFTIDLEYRDLDRKPKYIIIVASSSKYGDYFEGGVGSKLWLDALELIYPNSLSEIKQAK